MRPDDNDIGGTIPQSTMDPDPLAFSDAKPYWALIETGVYEALHRLNSKYIYWQSEHGYDYHEFQKAFGTITPIEETAMSLFGHWIVYGWDVAKQMVREVYPTLT